MRHAYVTPGIDEAALVRFAQNRDEPTTIHRHRWPEFGQWLCYPDSCYVVEGRSDRTR